ncbi:MAG: ABC transporter ATP-binding protein [Candidatus Hydrogenedentes bacterium]|nr:ABC transporter ATP-binding protein [Candidatus Hydrogenedentota bacterium]
MSTIQTKTNLEGRLLGYAYTPGLSVLESVNVAVGEGELAGIVGPNGCGKSTLLRLLAGMLPLQAGEVALNGRPLRDYAHRDRARHLAFLPQSVNPAFDLPVEEVVRLGRFPHGGGGSTAVQQAMARTDVAGLRGRAFSSLSGGERQRVLLAGVLAQEPHLMLLDEPTSALDLHHEAEVFHLLRGMARGGAGIAVVTHNLNAAAQYCDRIVLLGASHRCVAEGAAKAVFTEAHLSAAYGAAIRVARHPLTGGVFVAAQAPSGDAP